MYPAPFLVIVPGDLYPRWSRHLTKLALCNCKCLTLVLEYRPVGSLNEIEDGMQYHAKTPR